MATDGYSEILPTLDRLGVSAIPADVDVRNVAQLWLDSFAKYTESGDIDGVLSLFSSDAWWRDMLALTWAFRTFHTAPKIRKFLEDRLSVNAPTNFKLTDAKFQNLYPDLAWILGQFTFQTKVGQCSGIFRLIPTSEGGWIGFTFYTNLEDLKDFPEKIGALRNPLPNHGKWLAQREREREFVDSNPTVLIIGSGQSGLDLAARLKVLDIPTLVVEKNKRVGDQWRYRYQALCLHDPVWSNHLPYIPFPPTWPVYTPAQKLANWLEFYADALELNVWTSSTVTKATQDANNEWDVTVERADGSTRVLHVRHLVSAIGLGGNNPFIPKIEGQEEYQGQVLHSTQHNSARDHLGKKVFIVGAATSAHDIAADYAEHGVDVTIYQRDNTYIMTTKRGMPILNGNLWWEGQWPTDVADRIEASLPTWLTEEIAKRQTAAIAEADKELLDGLHKIGFRTHLGPDGRGFTAMGRRRGGGYYLDVGASQLLIDGKIKLKNDSQIKRFTKTGFEFEDGSTVDADVVLFATGFDSPMVTIKKLLGEDIASRVKPMWNLDEEGELRNVWRDTGVPNFWFMMGNLMWCRFHSKHLALQIKAIEEGVLGGSGSEYRYQ
ncbi:FAD/NAD(P)-binding domain-containing protein [Dichomitus squalens]|uniref:FAD/NAD(P)-binding domain-containing protein n=1 Tax=Dichomitus squalens TaxID=114155 RepID=A0A4Q9PSU8_9APHY|nr:FAD/NAD(P)-binding domain-containing protein [Dichomitus squalens]TBU46727.1 FAD/NAD(P)-binding domain-containing protein [Dichomitus squalens]TBU57480.1 FAD/NAD(P)-binding domain-containing protein [Dichomitus squalens]